MLCNSSSREECIFIPVEKKPQLLSKGLNSLCCAPSAQRALAGPQQAELAAAVAACVTQRVFPWLPGLHPALLGESALKPAVLATNPRRAECFPSSSPHATASSPAQGGLKRIAMTCHYPSNAVLLRQALRAPPPWCSARKITHVLFCVWSVTSITFQALARMLLREIRVPGFQRHSKEETELFVSKVE